VLPSQSFAESLYKITAAPKWVAPIRVHSSSDVPNAKIYEGVYYLLISRQIRVSKGVVDQYFHVVKQIISPQGVEAGSKVLMTFDPSNEKLTIHTIRIIRKDKVINELNSSSIHLLQREKKLDENIYSGVKTAGLLLNDLRVGDIVEYSYSIRDIDPVYAQHYANTLLMGYYVPIDRIYVRILLPHRRRLYIKNIKTDVEPSIKKAGSYTEYIWSKKHVPEVGRESQTPVWYSSVPGVQVSEYSNWHEVVNQVAEYYQPPNNFSPEFTNEIKSIESKATTIPEKIISVLQFVQTHIRYTGIEIGPRGYMPTDPSVVLSRRYGDCKDKAFLMVSMLKALGIPAHVALVSTVNRQQISKLLPSLTAFDHAIVEVDYQGKRYWLDPTNAYQSGTLQYREQPNYGLALIVDKNTHKLTPMDIQQRDTPNITINEVYNLRTKQKKAALYTVKTVYSGNKADLMRYYFSSFGKDWIQKSYLNYNSRYFPDIKLASLIETRNNAKKNQFIVIEKYTIPNYWKVKNENKKKTYIAPIDSFLLWSHFNNTNGSYRTAPMKITYPLNIDNNITVLLPSKWPTDNESYSIKNKIFEFSQKITYDGDTIHIFNHYKTKKDFVSPGYLSKYVDDLDNMEDQLSYDVYEKSAPKMTHVSRFHIPFIFSIVFSIILFSAIAIYIYRRNGKVRLVAGLEKYPSGIKGWLILPLIALIISPFVYLSLLFSTKYYIYELVWKKIIYASTYTLHAHVSALLVYYLAISGIFLFISSLLGLVLLFQKRRTFPLFYICMSIIVLLQFIIYIIIKSQTLVVSAYAEHVWITHLCVYIIEFGLCATYFLVSKRVKATFIRPKPKLTFGYLSLFILSTAFIILISFAGGIIKDLQQKNIKKKISATEKTLPQKKA